MMTSKDIIDLLQYRNFKWRGRDKNGIDCFGFFLECTKRMGQEVPDYVYTEQNAAKLLLKEYHKYFKEVESPILGDAILFHSDVIHIGVYLGNGQFIQFHKDYGARVDYLHQSPWFEQIRGYFRYIGKDGQDNIQA